MDYLAELGIDALWLTPWYPSPMDDGGYDVADLDAVVRFWFDRGVDGFRIDVADGLVKDPALPDVEDGDQTPFSDQEGLHEIYRSWRKIADGYPGERVLVGEMWLPDMSRAA